VTRNSFAVFVLAASITAAQASAASGVLGIATAVSTFSVDNSLVTGSANLSEGSEIQTTTAPTDLRLQNGVTVHLGTRSSGRVYSDRIVLREGAARVDNFSDYTIEARQLQIEAESPAAHAVVRLTGKTVEVASIGGALKVTDGASMLTRVPAGTKSSFQQTGAAPGQTGAAPAEKGPISDKKVFLWAAGVCLVAAAVVGGIAASQGKSPF
jgi:hypothetical protein